MTRELAGHPAVRARPSRMALAGLLLATALASLDQNIVATALPQIMAELGGLLQLSLVVTAFIVGSSSTILLYAKLSDIYGRRRLFVVSMLIFLAGSVMCGLAHSMTELIAFRCLQGMGGGGLLPLSQAALGDLVEPRERARYQGLFIGIFALCSLIGPVLGGFITATLSWHWIFYINLPLGAVALVFIIAGLPRKTSAAVHSIDYKGAVLTAATAGTLLLTFAGIEGALSASATLYVALCIIPFGIALVREERKAKEPILPVGLFRDRAFATTIVVITLNAMALITAIVYLPTYFQLVVGMGPEAAGMMIVPLMIGMVLASLLGGRLVARTGRYKIFPLIGLAVASGGFAALGWFAADARNVLAIGVCLAVVGAALGLVMPNLTIAIQNAVPRKDIGAASGAAVFFRLLGSAIGVALSGLIVAVQLPAADLLGAAHSVGGIALVSAGAPLQSYSPAMIEAFRQAVAITFSFGSAVAATAFFVSLFTPEQRLRSGDPRIVEAQSRG
jgi:EmrB/QacA subfamily drug resistance transporter